MKRRVLLARALASRPNLLLLDEPTNHLDIKAIDWLETFLASYSGALLFVTHDRVFLQKLATRILDLDRGRLKSYECDYETYLVRKQAAWKRKRSKTPSSTRSWPRRRSGFVRGFSPGEPATKAA